ncbi:HNH endonuclease [Bacillus sp. SCS-151]|uniref:HNH endonuclease n=1 Tax=Nanhaiella sioensis TaxID=3115293 RepID=UPI00397B8964
MEGFLLRSFLALVRKLPRKRLDLALWKELRKKVWLRDKKRCTRCSIELKLISCHIDHKQSGLLGTNEMKNLRTLCRKCHVLRADIRHQGMIDKALKDGVIKPGWRNHVWDD